MEGHRYRICRAKDCDRAARRWSVYCADHLTRIVYACSICGSEAHVYCNRPPSPVLRRLSRS